MPGISAQNPYVGPRPIQQGEPLHGRSVEVRELYHLLQARRIVVLHSPSGAGKSSLVQAGLIPKLKENHFDVWKPIRVNLDPQELSGIPKLTNRYLLSALVSLEEELPAERRRSPAALAGLGFLEYLESRPRRKGKEERPVVLLFDQFEEVLTAAPREVAQKQAFFSAVGKALDTGKYWALFILREDYLAAFSPYRDRLPTQMSNTFRLDLLGLEGAREAALLPALRGGRAFPAVDKLIVDLSTIRVQQADGSFVAEQGLSVEPLHLQVVCRRLWEAIPPEQASIEAKDLEAAGDVAEALRAFYEEVLHEVLRDPAFHRLGLRERRLRAWFGAPLITPAQTRGLVYRGATETEGLDNAVVDRLAAKYLIHAEIRGGGTWYELGHDRFVAPILEANAAWATGHVRALTLEAEAWEGANRDPSRLFEGTKLKRARAEILASPEQYGAVEEAFIVAGESVARARVRRRRWLAAGTVTFLAALVTISFLGLSAREAGERARQQQQWARSMQLAAASVETTQSPDLALLLAVEARRLWDSPYARSSLLSALLRGGPTPMRWFHGAATKEVKQIVFDNDRSLVAVDREGTAYLWDLASGRPDGGPRKGPEVSSVGGSPSLQIAVAPRGGALALVVEAAAAEPTANFVLRFGRSGEAALTASKDALLGNPTWMEWSPDGHRLATSDASGEVRVWDPARGVALSMRRAPGEAVETRRLSFSADGAWLAASGADGRVRLWASGTGEPLGTFEAGGENGMDALALGGAAGHRRLVGAGAEGTLLVWTEVDGRLGPTPKSLVFDPKASALFAAGLSAEQAGPAPLASFALLRFSPDGATLAAVTEAGFVVLFDVAEGRATGMLPAVHATWITAIAFTADGRTLATADRRGTIAVWDLGARTPEIVRVGEPRESIGKLVVSRTQNRIAWIHRDAPDIVRVRSLGTGSLDAQSLPPHPGLSSFELSADGQKMATGSAADGLVRVWDIATKSVVDEMHIDVPPPVAGRAESRLKLAFSADGQRLATRFGTSIRFRDLVTRETWASFSGRAELSWNFSSDGRRAVLDDPGGGLVIWDSRAGVPEGPPFGSAPGHTPWGVCFSPDESLLVEVDAKMALRMIDVATKQARSRFFGPGGGIDQVEVAPDNRLVAVARSEKRGDETAHVLQLWDANSGHLIGPGQKSGDGRVFSLAFGDAGRTLRSVDEWGAVLSWDIDPDRWVERACRAANRNLTLDEWSSFGGEEGRYRCTCPGLSAPPGVEKCP